MQQVIRETSQEYWRPARGSAQIAKAVLPESYCQHCGTLFAVGARYCHVCGTDRERMSSELLKLSPAALLNLDVLRQRVGLNVPSLVFLILGILGMLAAAISAYAYDPVAVQGGQAITALPIECLIAAIAAFAAGILLKK